jgi:glucosamine--fructose-6-phosphate aminotransferase (isomerizing)
MTVLYLLALHLGQQRGVLSEEESLAHIHALNGLPVKMEMLLGCDDLVEKLAREFHRAQDFLYLGRGSTIRSR